MFLRAVEYFVMFFLLCEKLNKHIVKAGELMSDM